MKKWVLFVLFFLLSPLFAEPLPASQVFQVNVSKIDPNTFSISWQIKKGYFLYADRIKLDPQIESNIHLGPERFPPAQSKTDKQGHEYKVYRNLLTLPIAVLGDKPGEGLLTLHYQGCSDEGFCYPPEEKQIKVSIDESLALNNIDIEKSEAVKPSSPEPRNEISQVFNSHNWFMILMTFYGFGLLLAFTPCILPMVPILSGIIVGHGKTVTTKKAFFLSLSYVLSMSLTYAAVGAVVASIGANLQISMQSPLAISLFSLIFILLALSMFGFYEFKLPTGWQSRIAGTSRRQRGGHYLGAAVMGCLSTLILSPCVTAPLIGVLSYIAQTNNVLYGTLTLFVLSLGMGTPLLLIGTSAGKWLPSAGSWMETVKNMFGVLMLALAIFLLSRILPALVSMSLWASLLIFSGIYCGALDSAILNKEKFNKSIGIILLSYGLFILLGASMGADNPIRPLEKIQATYVNTENSHAQNLSLATVQQMIKQAEGKPVMLDFYADWCTSCKVMEASTFKSPKVSALLKHFTIIKVDITENNEANKALMSYFHVIAPPAFLFFDTKGQPLDELTVVGESSDDEFLKILNQAQN